MAKKKRLNFGLAISATLMGNTMEWYDYSTYGFFVPILAHIFFVTSDHFLAVHQIFLIYAVGQIGRPIGGVIFGFIADRWGRKISLISSILLMTGPVLVISMMPTYLQIGLAAPLIFAAMRALQGISAGGEFPVIATYLVEYSPKFNRGFLGNFAFVGAFFGLFIGIGEYALIHFNMPLKTMYDWGWRIPFIVGVVIGCIAYYFRRKLSETPLFRETESHSAISKDPFLKMLQKNKTALMNLFGLGCLQTVSFNVVFICLTAHMMEFLNMSLEMAIVLNLLLLAFVVMFTPILGRAGDRWGHRKIAQYSAWGFLVFSYPLYLLLGQWPHICQVLALIGLALLIAGYSASLPVLFCDLFPTSVRASGIGLSYNLAVALIGGITPVTVHYLIRYLNMPNLSAFVLMGAAVISLIALWKLKTQRLYLTTEA